MSPTGRSCKIRSHCRWVPWDNPNWCCWHSAVQWSESLVLCLSLLTCLICKLFCWEICNECFAHKSLQKRLECGRKFKSKVAYMETKYNSPPSISFRPESWQLFWHACLLLSGQSHRQCHLTACLWTDDINSFHCCIITMKAILVYANTSIAV